MPPRIGPSPDKMLQARLLSYQDAHLYRIGANYRDLEVNRPKVPVNNYMRDGQFGGVRDEGTGHPNYYPNSVNGSPRPDRSYAEPAWNLGNDVTVDRWDSRVEHDDYTQPGNLFRLMSEEEKGRLASNIAESMVGCEQHIIDLQLEHFDAADSNYGERVRGALDEQAEGDAPVYQSVQPHV